LKSENLESFNERNFENVVYHYEKEIRRILRGLSVYKVLSKTERGILLRSGVLTRKGRGTNTKWTVSKKALDTLLKMEKESRNKLSS
jgi:hypothetical protein